MSATQLAGDEPDPLRRGARFTDVVAEVLRAADAVEQAGIGR